MPEPPYRLILDGLQDGKVIPFLGAGASLAGRAEGNKWKSPKDGFLPKAGELSDYLGQLTNFPSPEMELTRVAQYFDVVAGSGALGDQLHKVFAREYACGDLHELLAEYPCPLIMTTNYDDLMERAFRKKGRPFHTVIYRTGQQTFFVWEHGATEPREVYPNEMDLELGPVTVIYKMHGACDRNDKSRESYVITEDNYVEFLSRIAQQNAIPAVIAECFGESHFLFLGYGLKDWNLRVVLYEISRKWSRRYAAWAVQHTPPALEYEFWRDRGLTIFNITINEFLARLNQTKAIVADAAAAGGADGTSDR